MILNKVNFFSETLGLLRSRYVLLSKRTLTERQSKRCPKYPTLYLLHTHSDDHTGRQRYTSIERYAADLNLAVVMPVIDLSIHNDMTPRGTYW
jgi:putative tributyrin esterase